MGRRRLHENVDLRTGEGMDGRGVEGEGMDGRGVEGEGRGGARRAREGLGRGIPMR